MAPSAGELHLMAYVAQLTSLYDDQPLDEWRYRFAGTTAGSPFSPELDIAVDHSIAIGELSDSNGLLNVVESGRRTLAILASLDPNVRRAKYLDAAISCSLVLPMSLLRQGLAGDPELGAALTLRSARPLLAEPSLEWLRGQFATVRDSLGDMASVAAPAAAWLTALAHASLVDANRGER